eukprot:724688-Pelagomonas_calceolata.AAC.3
MHMQACLASIITIYMQACLASIIAIHMQACLASIIAILMQAHNHAHAGMPTQHRNHPHGHHSHPPIIQPFHAVFPVHLRGLKRAIRSALFCFSLEPSL